MSKTLIVSFLPCFLSVLAFAQDNQKILGKWKIVAANHEGVFYSVKNDSLSISKEWIQAITGGDSSIVELFTKEIKGIYSTQLYVFKSNGEYETNTQKDYYEKGTYTIDTKAKKLFTTPTNKEGFVGRVEILYQLDKNKLTFYTTQFGKKTQLELERELN